MISGMDAVGPWGVRGSHSMTLSSTAPVIMVSSSGEHSNETILQLHMKTHLRLCPEKVEMYLFSKRERYLMVSLDQLSCWLFTFQTNGRMVKERRMMSCSKEPNARSGNPVDASQFWIINGFENEKCICSVTSS